jgi:hypothetical protein
MMCVERLLTCHRPRIWTVRSLWVTKPTRKLVLLKVNIKIMLLRSDLCFATFNDRLSSNTRRVRMMGQLLISQKPM